MHIVIEYDSERVDPLLPFPVIAQYLKDVASNWPSGWHQWIAFQVNLLPKVDGVHATVELRGLPWELNVQKVRFDLLVDSGRITHVMRESGGAYISPSFLAEELLPGIRHTIKWWLAKERRKLTESEHYMLSPEVSVI